MSDQQSILTPDQRLRVFVSSTLGELAEERKAARDAIEGLRLAPVMFELGARPHPPRALYRAYLDQSHVFVAIYWQRYGWVAPDETVSGLEDEYNLSHSKPRLIYIKAPAPERESRLEDLLDRIRDDDHASYKFFETPSELRRLIQDDLMVLLSERFEAMKVARESAGSAREQIREVSSNLPVPSTPLVGRQSELAELRELLLREEVRLVTLTGAGGIGKTRLAETLGGQLLESFRDGVVFVSLAPISDPSLVVDTIARTVGIAGEDSGQPLLETLKQHLRHVEMLLLLDNFEQVLETSPVVAELLAASPGLKFLVTSRTTLRLSGEQEFPVPPLSVPAAESLPDFESLSQYEAVRLFIERARAVKPDFAVNNQNAPAVAGICRQLDGLPLAIELAAARTKLLSPQAILSRLDKSLKLLTGGARDLPARQQTLRNTIDWSYRLLDANEQRLFARLGVFVGGCTLEAAEAVGSGDGIGEESVLDLVSQLVDKSLLLAEVVGEGRERYRMLEPIRQYGRERLSQSGEADAVSRRHAAFFLALAEEADAELIGPQQRSWLQRLETEHNNIRAALHWMLERGEAELALRLGGALWWFWYARSHLTEGQRWLEELLGGSGAVSAPVRAKALDGVGWLAECQGDYGRARAAYEERLKLSREAGDERGVGISLGNMGSVELAQGNYERAATLLEESLAVLRGLGNERDIARILTDLGRLALCQDNRTQAIGFFEEALVLGRKVSDAQGTAISLSNLGYTVLIFGDSERAATLLEESLAQYRAVGDTQGIAIDLINLGLAALFEGDHERALTLLRESLTTLQDVRNKLTIAQCLEAMACLAGAQGKIERAARVWGAAQALREGIGAPLPPDERDLHEPYVTAARSRLGEEMWEATCTQGRAMSLEGAIEYALSDQEPTSSTSSAPERHRPI